MLTETDDIKWDKIITPKQGKLSLQLGRVWDYRDLVFLFVKRDFITYYKQTIFGPIWYLVQPLLSTMMYMLIFGSLAQIGTDSIPQILFYFSGTMLWTYFSGNLRDVSNVFQANKGMFGKVFFPRMVVPIASTLGLLIKLGVQFLLFVLLYIYYLVNGAAITVSWSIVLFPLVIIWLSLLSCGLGMIVSSITTKYRDLALVLDFLISLLMYATPVVYPLSEVPANFKVLFCLNPISAPIELFRYCFFGVCSIPVWASCYSFVVTVIVFIFGIYMFNKNERTFVDVI